VVSAALHRMEQPSIRSDLQCVKESGGGRMLAVGREAAVALRGMCCLCCSSCAWCAPRAHVRKPYVCIYIIEFHRCSQMLLLCVTVVQAVAMRVQKNWRNYPGKGPPISMQRVQNIRCVLVECILATCLFHLITLPCQILRQLLDQCRQDASGIEKVVIVSNYINTLNHVEVHISSIGTASQ
jgi:hypothetical protein